MKVGGIKTWKELTIGVQQMVRLLFNNNFINPRTCPLKRPLSDSPGKKNIWILPPGLCTSKIGIRDVSSPEREIMSIQRSGPLCKISHPILNIERSFLVIQS